MYAPWSRGLGQTLRAIRNHESAGRISPATAARLRRAVAAAYLESYIDKTLSKPRGRLLTAAHRLEDLLASRQAQGLD